MKSDNASQEYGLKESATVGTRVKEAPELGGQPAELPEWEEVKDNILLKDCDRAVLHRLRMKGRLR